MLGSRDKQIPGIYYLATIAEPRNFRFQSDMLSDDEVVGVLRDNVDLYSICSYFCTYTCIHMYKCTPTCIYITHYSHTHILPT